MGWTTGVQFLTGAMIESFLFSTASRPALGPTQPPIQWVTGTISLGIRQPGNEADHSPPPNANITDA